MTTSSWHERKINLSSTIIIGAITLFIGVLTGLNWDKFAPYLSLKTEKPSATMDWSPLNSVYNQLVYYYDGDIDPATVIEGAKKGLVAALGDTYTVYMDKEEAADFTASLHGDVGAGIGVELAERENYVKIIRLLPDNPAKRVGLLAGDIIYKINGEEVYTESVEQIAQKLRGAAGTSVKLSVVRNNTELEFEIIRETLNNVSAYVDYDGTTAIITVTRFDDDTGQIVQKFAREFADKKNNKVILDLRSNTGGFVSAAQELLALWISGDKVFIQKSKKSGDDTIYTVRGQDILSQTKTIVLVNGTSASASEIVAGALQDYKKATILGEKTFGKGVVQTMHNFADNSILKVTTAHWYTPLGNNINNAGVTPDIVIENTYDDINAGRDPQMDAAKKL